MGLDCKLGLVRECNPQNYFDGALDDVGFFAGCPTASASASHTLALTLGFNLASQVC